MQVSDKTKKATVRLLVANALYVAVIAALVAIYSSLREIPMVEAIGNLWIAILVTWATVSIAAWRNKDLDS